jgi:uncharacterized protein YjiS (DUF1127 family)
MNSLVPATLTDFHPSSRPVEAGHWALLASAAATLRLWSKRIREKRALERLDERELADFGASRSDVYAELRRPFWRAPPPPI